MNEQLYHNTTSRRLLRLLLLLLMMVGAEGAWGQNVTIADIDFSSPIINRVADGRVNSMAIGIHETYPTTINNDGRLVLGNTSNRVTIPESQREGNVVTVSFDLAFGKLLDRYVYFYLKDINDGIIGSFYFQPYNSTLTTNLNVETSDLYYSNNTVLWDKKVTFIITLNYSTNKIKTATSCSGASNPSTNHEVDMTNTNRFAIFEVGSTYSNADRYCQFDNLRITTNTTDYYSYKLKSNLGSVIASGTATDGSLVIPYPQLELNGTSIYETGTNSSSDYYRKAYTISSSYANGLYESLNYSNKADNVVFFSEAEDIVGAGVIDNNNADIRCSMAAGARFNSALKVTSLFPGYYAISARSIGGNSQTYTAKVADVEVWSYTPANSPNESSSSEFLVGEKADITIQGGDNSRMLDWLYIKSTRAISFPITSGTMSQHSTKTVTVYNASLSTTYTSSDETIAKVASNGDGTITISSLGKNGSATITATEDGNTNTYTITVELGTLGFAETARTTYLEDLTYQYEATSSSTGTITYSVPAGNGVAYIDNANTGLLRLVSPGNVVVTATDARGLTTTYSLTVSTRSTLTAASLVNGQTFDVGTQVGQLVDESVTIGGTKLSFGANSAINSKDEKQVVRTIRGGYGLTCIDLSGYTHSYFKNFDELNEQWGTYYRIDTGDKVNTIIISGYFADDVTHLYLFDSTGKKLMTLYNTGANLASVVMDDKLLKPNSTYYLYCPGTVFALKSFTHTDIKTELDYSDSFKGVVFCGDAISAPTLTIMDAEGNNISSHYTKGTYTSSKPAIASVNSTTGALTAYSTKGRVVVTLPLTSDAPASYPHLVVTDTIDVTDGIWEFTRYDRDHGTYYMYGSPGWTGGYSDRNMPRDNKDFEFILMNQEFIARSPSYVTFQYGEPLPLAIGLRTRYKQRLITGGNDHISDYAGGQLHLFGSGSTGTAAAAAWGHGGEVMVPVKKDMLVEINCYSDDALSEMEIEGATELDGTNAQYFYVNSGAAQTFQFIAKDNGFVYIKNSSINLDLHINYIKAVSSLVFENGSETYVEAGKPYINQIDNLGEASISSYAYENKKNAPVTGINTTSGQVTLGGAKGIFEVTAVASDGRRGTYRATALDFEMQNLEATVGAGASTVFDLQDAIKTLNTGNTFGDDPSPEKTAKEDAIKTEVVYTIEDETTVATLAGTSLTIEGAGTITLRAKLGSIEQTFTCTVAGGALGYYDGSADVACPNPVIKNTSESYIIKIIGGGSNFKFKVKDMYDAIIGEKLIANKSSLHFFKMGASDYELIDDPSSTAEVVSQTLKITGFNTIEASVGSEFGGVIPIYASYDYGSPATPHELVGTLTIAYAKHIWNFESNMTEELADWYVDKDTNQKTGKWASTATFDMPTDADDDTYASSNADSHKDSHDWRFVRKIGGTHRESAIIYYYNHNVEYSNALVIPRTEGLHIHSTKNGQQLGVEMAAQRVTRKPNGQNEKYYYGWGMAVAYNDDGTRFVEYPIVENGTLTNAGDAEHFVFDKDGNTTSYTNQYLSGNANKKYNCSNLMVKRGGKIVIPKVKPGQWIEVRWTRHQDDMAERIIMENLCDVDGNYISQVYKIGNCFYNLDYSTSTYMFQVAPVGTDRGDGSTVTTDEDGYVDVSFEIADNIYISIQQIELHEPNWDYRSSIVSQLNGFVNDKDKDPRDRYYTDDFYKTLNSTTGELELTWATLTLDESDQDIGKTKEAAPHVKWQYVWDDLGSHTITFFPKSLQNAPNAPQTWTFDIDDQLKQEGAVMTYTDDMNSEATLTYNGGWGKVKITMTSYSQNMKYIANKKSWTITFGQAPKQTYPYTWDFTKYFQKTYDYIGSFTTWDRSERIATTNTNNYNTQNYTSYYVNGAQLVSEGIWNNNKTTKGLVPETEGLGFKLTGLGSTGKVTLNMANGVDNSGMFAELVENTNYRTWKPSGYLKITSGGSVIVPKPGVVPDTEAPASNYYIYIKSNVEPSYNENVKKMVSSGASATQENDANYDVPTGTYKYHFTANANAEFTFSSDAEIYAIGVTNILKQMTPLSGTAWATESRDHAIDYTLDSLLTINPVRAYAIIEQSGNPIYSDDKSKTTVAIKDQRYVVPAKQGLVLKQIQKYDDDSSEYVNIANNATPYSVPLFYPAITTAEDPAYRYANNLMRPNMTESTFTQERETATGEEDANGEFTRFILANRYMTWQKEGANAATTDGTLHTGKKPVFYRLHLYTQEEAKELFPGESENYYIKLNTLGANKAYLLLRTDKINDPIWPSASPAREYIGISGVSDMDEETGETVRTDYEGGRTYNMGGQAVDTDGALPPGIYIRNGKKMIVK